ncbi:MAG: hypothetical protein JW829_06805 [Pirellulales bacterium]|nr:hypothetical protein [Pirellulales bacterium]
MLIEHAIHTSSQTTGNEGYQIVAASPGIDDSELGQLALWCPSHDGLLPEFCASGSISFFQLSDGKNWITRTRTAGTEYSDRGGYRLVTHCMRIPDEIFIKFSNNPFSVLDAVVAGGHLDIDIDGVLPKEGKIQPVALIGRARAFDPIRLRAWERTLGHHLLIQIVDSCCTSTHLAFVGGSEVFSWLAALVNILPVSTRKVISFSTGQRAVASRKFRWTSAPDDYHLLRRWQLDGIRIIHCHSKPDRSTTPVATQANGKKLNGWTSFLDYCLTQNRLDAFQIAIEHDDAPNNLKSLDDFANHTRSILKL